jgi:hexosaminidase
MKIAARKAQFFLVFVLLLILIAGDLQASQPPVIPLPASFVLNEGYFGLEKPIGVIAPSSNNHHIADLAIKCLSETGYRAFVADDRMLAGQHLTIQLSGSFDSIIGNEGYYLHISSSQIQIVANTSAGIQYALNTLGQLLRNAKDNFLPAWSIIDHPRFSFRGMHLDVSRHFMPFDFILRYIDILAMHRINTFHWHLVDDQGWRIQIDQYPLLTEVGAWREDRSHEHWNHRPLSNPEAPKTYGGFYTKAQIRQAVAYAAERNINIIPEIEMPAHVMSALAAYPELSCSGENLGVPPGGIWPITHIYCAGKEETFSFLENVLTEVMELFPSPIIHIGGDEADKTEWESCARCQERMTKESLPDVHALQSYFIERIGRFLESKGRRLMGWDEILEGGLAKNAIVMSWRGEEGGIQAARMGHKVVMTPGSHCYFDHYQGDPATEPLAIGGFTPLNKVYAYEPIPTALTPEEATFVLGTQANVWTEYMPDPNHVEYMVLPRLAALAEVMWSPQKHRDWDQFVLRLPGIIKQYEAFGLNYARSAWKVQVSETLDDASGKLTLTLGTLLPVDSIVFALEGESFDGKLYTYRQPLLLEKSANLSAFTVIGNNLTPVIRRNYLVHKAFGIPVSQIPAPSAKYPGSTISLTDGIAGTRWYNDGNWTGILDNHWQAAIAFPYAVEVNTVSLLALSDPASWIFLPDSILVYASKNGRRFRKVGALQQRYNLTAAAASTHIFPIKMKSGRYKAIRLEAHRTAPLPESHPGYGKNVWMFFSEIAVE